MNRTTEHCASRTRPCRWRAIHWLVVLAAFAPLSALGWFETYEPEVVVAAPYIDLHTGPGRGYPIFHSVLAGESLVLLKRRTSWLQVRAGRDTIGWIPEAALRQTRDAAGRTPAVTERGLAQYAQRRWEYGIAAGDFDGAASLGAHLGYGLTQNIMLQLEVSQIMGDYSDAVMATGNIVMVPFPEWRVSPFFKIGTGIIEVRPQTTIVRSRDRTDEIVAAGLGATLYLGDRFALRAEYQRHTVLTSRDTNEEIDQWKAGFSVYF